MKELAKIRILSFLTILAFVINAFVPFFAVYNIAAAQAAEQSDIQSFDEKILICTADGFKWVTWEELQQEETDHQTPDQKHYECPLCYVSAHGLKDFLPATAVIVTQKLSKEHTESAGYAETVTKPRFAVAGYRTRAPPHLA